MTVQEFIYDLKKIKTFKKLPDDQYADKDDAFVRNFILNLEILLNPYPQRTDRNLKRVQKIIKRTYQDL